MFLRSFRVASHCLIIRLDEAIKVEGRKSICFAAQKLPPVAWGALLPLKGTNYCSGFRTKIC